MILGRAAPPWPYDSVAPDSVLSFPDAERDAGDAAWLRPARSTARYWSSDEFSGLLADASMWLPVRIVPAVSCPLAFDSRSIPSIGRILLLKLLP